MTLTITDCYLYWQWRSKRGGGRAVRPGRQNVGDTEKFGKMESIFKGGKRF